MLCFTTVEPHRLIFILDLKLYLFRHLTKISKVTVSDLQLFPGLFQFFSSKFMNSFEKIEACLFIVWFCEQEGFVSELDQQVENFIFPEC